MHGIIPNPLGAALLVAAVPAAGRRLRLWGRSW
jgi:hypothetical protein